MSQTAPEFEKKSAAFADALVRTDNALLSLGPAIAAVREPVSPQLARAAQATENAWRRMEHQFGLHSSAQIAELVGYRSNRTWASQQRSAGRLLGVRRGGGFRFPGFQVSPAGRIAPVMADLISAAREHGWSDESLALWLASPSGRMPDDRCPAEFLHDDPERVLSAARAAMQPAW